MTERDMDTFEDRFARRLSRHAAIPVTRVDADAIARAAVAARRPLRRLLVSWTRLPALGWVVIALGMAIAAGLLAGALLQLVRQPSGPSLVLALEDGLYVGEPDSASRQRLRADGTFIQPRWSPDGRHIAVLHGPPVSPQINAGAPPRTPNRFELRPDELLVLDADGTTVSRYPGPITDHAWGPPGDDGRSLLAVGTKDGRIAVLGDDGRTIAEWAWDALPDDPAFDGDLSPPRLAWASPTRLVAALGGEVVAFDARDGSGPAPVASPGLARVTSVAAGPGGNVVAFIAADCVARCMGAVRVVRVPDVPSSAPAPAGRIVLPAVEASTALAWASDGETILAWPFLAPVGDRTTTRVPIDRAPVLVNRDIVPAWARYAPDGSGRYALLNVYSAFDDRHFDAWLLDDDGQATRIGVRSLGFDLRPPTAP